MAINLEHLIIEPVLPAEPGDVEELTTQLRAYNHDKLWQNVKQPIGCFIRDLEGKLIGGVFGFNSWGWLNIELVWVDENYRDNDLATKMMEKMEQYSIIEGLSRIKLETGSFQALDFYKKLGFEVYAELDDYPVGQTNYYLKKILES
ncbi:GNAT family N-acetyltransferase [Psychrobium sp. 1_MG-2023]|uniref:GNAT family N-acetyltransferase n=1 Tax=Psychrobium sp. 1_MG-2023 TaxID=3062624 RepID=UPI000C34FE13|nr:GNAT family N-acetyltransferase [Psychrobium sp. 1_MG-2023]MDP2562880.1 GNAT family N-acetyltransferase [Psychrobium sp. 1_MG-2023]PKF57144.1 GNAT family N-acetyltransferase [Alteromonadales bacterium alter-6D02]